MAELEPARAVSRTIGYDRVVDEFMIKFARTLQMDWLLPGVPAADKLVEVATVTVVQSRTARWPRSVFNRTGPRSQFS